MQILRRGGADERRSHWFTRNVLPLPPNRKAEGTGSPPANVSNHMPATAAPETPAADPPEGGAT